MRPFDSVGLRGARDAAARDLKSVADIHIPNDGERLIVIARRKPVRLVWSRKLEEQGLCKPLPKPRKKPKKKKP